MARITGTGMTAAGAALTAIVFCSAADAAAWDAHAPEATFVYRNKPIDPRCVTGFVSGDESPNSIALASCTKPGAVKRDKDWFTVEEPDAGAMSTPYDSYSVLGRDGARFALAAEWSGGGTGDFDSLLILRREGDRLVAEPGPQAGGDRCNGGISGAKVQGSTLAWSENLTPYDLVVQGGIKSLTAYTDLEASASSCVGTRNLEYDPDKKTTRLVSVTLEAGAAMGEGGKIADRPGWTEQYTYQHCFNDYYNGYVARGKTLLSPAETAAFAKGFAGTCLKPPN